MCNHLSPILMMRGLVIEETHFKFNKMNSLNIKMILELFFPGASQIFGRILTQTSCVGMCTLKVWPLFQWIKIGKWEGTVVLWDYQKVRWFVLTLLLTDAPEALVAWVQIPCTYLYVQSTVKHFLVIEINMVKLNLHFCYLKSFLLVFTSNMLIGFYFLFKFL